MDTRSVLQIGNVQFFEDRFSCISHFRSMPWWKKLESSIRSYGAYIFHLLHQCYAIFYQTKKQKKSLARFSSGDFSKKRLVVCLNGLCSSHLELKKIVKAIEKKELSETDIFLPNILEQGNAKLDDVLRPIYKKIKNWAQKSGEKELVLVGVSNGGRIARAIEAKLVNSDSCGNIAKLKFISIVGACKGSSLVNLAKRLGLNMFMSKPIFEEMPTDSARSRQLNQDWEKAQIKGPLREYTLIASPHDWLVPNYDSSLLKVSQHVARYAIIRGHGHVSLIDAVAEPVAEMIFM